MSGEAQFSRAFSTFRFFNHLGVRLVREAGVMFGDIAFVGVVVTIFIAVMMMSELEQEVPMRDPGPTRAAYRGEEQSHNEQRRNDAAEDDCLAHSNRCVRIHTSGRTLSGEGDSSSQRQV